MCFFAVVVTVITIVIIFTIIYVVNMHLCVLKTFSYDYIINIV